MKKSLQALLGLNLLILLLTLLDFLALHDIQNDYVNTEILESLQISISAPLPTWPATTGEWMLVAISFWGRLLLTTVSLAFIWKLIQKIKWEQ